MSNPAQEHPFAQYVRILGKGKTGTRSLNLEEARSAFGQIMRGEVEPVQLGAFLMLLRVKEESAQEIAGFVLACREAMAPPPKGLTVDLDWSSYAGKRHQHPWYILSLLLLTGAGHRVLVHGSAGHTPGRLYTEQAMRQLALPVADNWQHAADQLNNCNLSFLPLQALCEPLERIMHLKSLLGLRSPVNTLVRLLNPLNANASVQSIFHPAYAHIHHAAGQLLGQTSALVFKGDSGEIELKPHADTRLHYLLQGRSEALIAPRTIPGRVERIDTPRIEPVRALWQGATEDEYGLQACLGTTAAALRTLQPSLSYLEALKSAKQLWLHRNKGRLD